MRTRTGKYFECHHRRTVIIECKPFDACPVKVPEYKRLNVLRGRFFLLPRDAQRSRVTTMRAVLVTSGERLIAEKCRQIQIIRGLVTVSGR